MHGNKELHIRVHDKLVYDQHQKCCLHLIELKHQQREQKTAIKLTEPNKGAVAIHRS